MAKVSFAQITPIKEVENITIQFKDKDIVVKQYLPIKDKADLVDYVIQSSFDSQGLFSPIRQTIYTTLGLLKWYTNINFTVAILDDVEKTYDKIVLNGICEILKNIPEDELNCIQTMINGAIIETKSYIQSFVGQLKMSSNDYDKTKFDLEEFAKTLEDPNQIGFLKELMEKMG